MENPNTISCSSNPLVEGDPPAFVIGSNVIRVLIAFLRQHANKEKTVLQFLRDFELNIDTLATEQQKGDSVVPCDCKGKGHLVDSDGGSRRSRYWYAKCEIASLLEKMERIFQAVVGSGGCANYPASANIQSCYCGYCSLKREVRKIIDQK